VGLLPRFGGVKPDMVLQTATSVKNNAEKPLQFNIFPDGGRDFS
jgi:hypothetical protein